MYKLFLVVRDTYVKIVRTRSYWISVLIPVIVIGILYAFSLLSTRYLDTRDIGVYSRNRTVQKIVEKQKNRELNFIGFSSINDAKKYLYSKKIDNFIDIVEKNGELRAIIYGENILTDNQKTNIQNSLDITQLIYVAKINGVSEKSDKLLNNRVAISERNIGSKSKNSQLKITFSYIACMVIFFMVMTYSNIIAQEIANEKGLRIMEVILSSISAKIHFYGKLLGAILAILTQLILTGGLLVISFLLFREVTYIRKILSYIAEAKFEWEFILIVGMFTLFGCVFYSILSAISGSLVSRVEDATKANMPITYLLFIAYFIGIGVAPKIPESVIVKISNYIPFFSPVIIPVSLANDSISIIKALASLIILIFSIIISTIISAKIYEKNVLIYDQNSVWTTLRNIIHKKYYRM